MPFLLDLLNEDLNENKGLSVRGTDEPVNISHNEFT